MILMVISLGIFAEERWTSCEGISKNHAFSLTRFDPSSARSANTVGSDDLEYINKFNLINLMCSKLSKVKPYFRGITDYNFELSPSYFGNQSLLKLQRYIRQYETFEISPHIEKLEDSNRSRLDYITNVRLNRESGFKEISIISRCFKSKVRDIEVHSCQAIKLCENLDSSELTYSPDGSIYDKACKKLKLR